MAEGKVIPMPERPKESPGELAELLREHLIGARGYDGKELSIDEVRGFVTEALERGWIQNDGQIDVLTTAYVLYDYGASFGMIQMCLDPRGALLVSNLATSLPLLAAPDEEGTDGHKAS